MQQTREDLDLLLDALVANLPQMIKDHPDDADFWPAFAGEADVIEDSSREHSEHVHSRIQCMLGSAALIPSDNEGESCK